MLQCAGMAYYTVRIGDVIYTYIMCLYNMYIHMYMYACECNRSSLTLVLILLVFTQYPFLQLLSITPLVSLSDLLLVLCMHILHYVIFTLHII